jgi:hypothetical protein
MSRKTAPSITPVANHFLLCVPDVVSTKPTDPMMADTWFAGSTPRMWVLKFSRAVKSVGQLAEALMKLKKKAHPSTLAAPIRATKYPIANHVQRVALKRLLSYRMNPERRKPPIRASMTVSNQVALLEITGFVSTFIAIWFHSKEPKSWLAAIALGIIIILVLAAQMALLTGASTGFSHVISSTVNFTLP